LLFSNLDETQWNPGCHAYYFKPQTRIPQSCIQATKQYLIRLWTDSTYILMCNLLLFCSLDETQWNPGCQAYYIKPNSLIPQSYIAYIEVGAKSRFLKKGARAGRSCIRATRE